MPLSGIEDREPGVECFVEALRVKARVEDDGGRGVVARFVGRFGDDEALRVGWPRFGRWRTKDRRRGDEVAMLRKKYIPRVCLSRYTSVFYKKYVGCYGCARSANFVYYFKSIYSCLLYILDTPYSQSHRQLSSLYSVETTKEALSSGLYIFSNKSSDFLKLSTRAWSESTIQSACIPASQRMHA